MGALFTKGTKQVCLVGQQGDPAQVHGLSAIADFGITKAILYIPKHIFDFCPATG